MRLKCIQSSCFYVVKAAFVLSLLFVNAELGMCADYVFYVDAAPWVSSKADQLSEEMVEIIQADRSGEVKLEIKYVFNDCTSGYCIPHIEKYEKGLLGKKIQTQYLSKDAFANDLSELSSSGGGYSGLESYKALFADVAKTGGKANTKVFVYDRFVCLSGDVAGLNESFANNAGYFRDLFDRLGSNVVIWPGFKDYVVRPNECKVLGDFCWGERKKPLLEVAELGDPVAVVEPAEEKLPDANAVISENEIANDIAVDTADDEPPLDSGQTEPDSVPENGVLALIFDDFNRELLDVNVAGVFSAGEIKIEISGIDGSQPTHGFAVAYNSSDPRPCPLGETVSFKYMNEVNELVVIKYFNNYEHTTYHIPISFIIGDSNG